MSDKEMKDAVKEAFKEWLDVQVTLIGWWSIRTIAGIIVAALVYMTFKNGWKPV